MPTAKELETATDAAEERLKVLADILQSYQNARFINTSRNGDRVETAASIEIEAIKAMLNDVQKQFSALPVSLQYTDPDFADPRNKLHLLMTKRLPELEVRYKHLYSILPKRTAAPPFRPTKYGNDDDVGRRMRRLAP